MHLELAGDRGELFREAGRLQVEAFERPLDAHEEQLQLVVLVLVGVKDVGSMRVKEVGDSGHYPPAIGAVNQQDGGVLH